ncbi:unnamed protein product [Parajaminaea phylloscopi]
MPALAVDLAAVTEPIPQFFQEVQHSLANHRKNAVALHRIHSQCSTVTEETPRGVKLVGEKAFNTAFVACLNRVLVLKKGVTQADRCLKFVASYANYAQGQFRKDNPDLEEDEDTTATRFVTIMIKHLIKGLRAKSKHVRLRACQTIALLVSGLESMDDDLYQSLLRGLLARIRDKEVPVRVQAVLALSKLQSGEEQDEPGAGYFDDEDEDDGDADDTLTFVPDSKSVRRQLLEVIRSDPSAEVRRAALFNIPITASTLPAVLERLRDTDAVNRRCVYLGSLHAGLSGPDATQLSPEHMHHIVHTGLGEREETVRKACEKLITAWVDQDGGDCAKLMDRFDGLIYPESTMSAFKAAFESRPALLDSVALDDAFWGDLTPNSALLARTVLEHLKGKGQAAATRLEELMPLVMALAFRIQSVWEGLVQVIDAEYTDEEAEEAEVLAQSQTAVLDSLLHIALISDYGDEIGRRKMFTLLREMISHSSLPQSLIEPCTDVLLKLSAGQRDFVRIVVEIVQELAEEDAPGQLRAEGEDEDEGDDDDDDDDDDAAEVEDLTQTHIHRRTKSGDSEGSGGSGKAESDSRRLLLVRVMLERMASNLHENTAIHGLIPQLIAPAVRSKDAFVRQQGLICLGLCCLLDSALALDTFPLFLDQIQHADGDIKVRATQAVFDLLLVHGIPFLSSRQALAVGGGAEAAAMAYSQIVGFLLSLLEDDQEAVQASAAEGIAKLMLAGMVEDDEALRSLVLVYMSPEMTSNQEMRQCLNYFLPVYCYTSTTNQRRLQRVVVPVLQVLAEVYNEVAGEQDMVSPAQVGAQLLEWSDPERAVNVAVPSDRCIHFDIGLELVQTLLTSDDRDERKTMVQMLNKLVLPEAECLDAARGKTFFLLAAKLREVNPFEEATLRNAFNRFELACAKRYPDLVGAARQADLATDEDLEKLRGFLESCNLDLAVDDGGIVEADTTTDSATAARGVGKKRVPSAKHASGGVRTVSGASSNASASRRTVSMASTAASAATSREEDDSVREASEEEEGEAEADDDDDDEGEGDIDEEMSEDE